MSRVAISKITISPTPFTNKILDQHCRHVITRHAEFTDNMERKICRSFFVAMQVASRILAAACPATAGPREADCSELKANQEGE